MIIPRRLLNEGDLEGLLESDEDFVLNNIDTCVKFLEEEVAKTMYDKLDTLARKISMQTRERLQMEYPRMFDDNLNMDSMVKIKPGNKYVKIDVGHSGKYMVDVATGNIYGIKGYGQIHRGHQYGTLDTIEDWYWGGYVAGKINK